METILDQECLVETRQELAWAKQWELALDQQSERVQEELE